MPPSCEHQDFDCFVTVNRIAAEKRFMADVTIKCSQCGLPFRFLGLPLGLDMNGASVSANGEEARLAIAPQGEGVPEFEGGVQGFTIRKRK